MKELLAARQILVVSGGAVIIVILLGGMLYVGHGLFQEETPEALSRSDYSRVVAQQATAVGRSRKTEQVAAANRAAGPDGTPAHGSPELESPTEPSDSADPTVTLTALESGDTDKATEDASAGSGQDLSSDAPQDIGARQDSDAPQDTDARPEDVTGESERDRKPHVTDVAVGEEVDNEVPATRSDLATEVQHLLDTLKSEPAVHSPADGQAVLVQNQLDALQRKYQFRQKLLNDRAALEKTGREKTDAIENNRLAQKKCDADQMELRALHARVAGEWQFANLQLQNARSPREVQFWQMRIAQCKNRLKALEGQMQATLNRRQTLQGEERKLTADWRNIEQGFDELVRRENRLASEWLEVLDRYGQLPHDYHKQAVLTTNVWLAGDSEFLAGYLHRGFAKIHQGTPQDAIADFSQVLKSLQANHKPEIRFPRFEGDVDELSGIALAGRGRAYTLVGDKKHALDDFGQAVGNNRKNVMAYVFRGQFYLRTGECGRAERDSAKAMDLDKQDPVPRREMARVLLESSDARKILQAERFAKEACQLSSNNDWVSLEIYATALARNGKIAEARKTYQQALDLAPLEARGSITDNLASLARRR